MSNSAEVTILLKQLSKMQEELDSKEKTIKILSEEKRKFRMWVPVKSGEKRRHI